MFDSVKGTADIGLPLPGKMVPMAVLAGLTRHNWRREAFSGVTFAAVSAPLAIAYAQFAGLPPVAGLYGLIVPAVLFALFAASGQLVAAPAAAPAALAAASIAVVAHPAGASALQLATAQALLAAAAFAALALLRLGFVASALARPAVVGLVTAVVLGLLVRELGALLGTPLDDRPATTFFPLLGHLLQSLGGINAWSLVLGGVCLLVLLVGRRFWHAVPWELLVLAAAIAAYSVFGFGHQGVALVAAVPGGPPPLSWPVVGWGQWLGLIPGAVGIALVTASEASIIDRSRRSMLGFAIANLAAGVTGSFPVGAGGERAQRMHQAGARSQLPGLVGAVLVFTLLVLSAELVHAVPEPALAGAVFALAFPLLRLREFGRLWRLQKSAFLMAVVALAATLVFGIFTGLAVAVGLTVIAVLRRAASPPVDLVDASGNPRASLRAHDAGRRLSAPGVAVVRFAGPLDFASAEAFEHAIRKAVGDGLAAGLAHLVIDCEAVGELDATAAQIVGETLAWVLDQGVTVDYSRARAALRVEFEHYGLLGGSRVFDDNAQAIAELSG